MTVFNISQLHLNTVLLVYSERDTIQLGPDYQRASEIWNLEKRQLLIDSILNGYDIPKIYFHKFLKPLKKGNRQFQYAIIDGKQRLESIWQFIDGSFPLDDECEYVKEDLKLGSLTYDELGKHYPLLKARLDGYPLPIICVETDDLELIEDMFSRLNEAVPLSAAEKRNAFGGPMPQLIRKLTKHKFFAKNVPFSNTRYRHFDLAAEFLLIEQAKKIVDTKKVYLDEFVKSWRGHQLRSAKKIAADVTKTLDTMAKVFVNRDVLLRSVGMIALYYHAFHLAIENGWVNKLSRISLQKFEKRRLENRVIAEEDLGKANYDLLEFDRLVQTPNDSYAIEFRLRILLDGQFRRKLPDSYSAAGEKDKRN